MKHTTFFRNGTHTTARTSRWLALLAFAGLAFTTAPAFAQAPPAMDSLTFEQVAKMRRTQATLYSPVRLVDNQSIGIHLLTAYTPARVAGGEHGVRVIVYVVKPDLSGFEVLSNTTEPTSAAGGGGGAGKVSMHDISWSTIPKNHLAADGSAHVIVAVVGYNIARTGASATPALLPRELFLSAKVEQSEIGMLLPAIQKAR